MNSILKGSQNQNMANMFSQFKQNPVGFLMQKNFNIPNNIQNDPQAIVQHLLNTGQMSQGQLNQLQKLVQNTKR